MPMRRTIGISLACLVSGFCCGAAQQATAADYRSERVEQRFASFKSGAAACGAAAGRSQLGKAAWYNLVGNHTANGEILDTVTATAAHCSLPLASFARVTNLGNGRSVIVKINDRGPFTRGRILDLSPRAADLLDMKRAGVAEVVLEPLAPQPTPTIAAFQTSDASIAQ